MTNKKPKKTMNNNQIKIFGTKTGINIIESPIKAKIYQFLKKKKVVLQR